MAFIRINRKLFEHNFWKENREYSRAEAWIDLIQLVSFTDNNKKIIDGVIIKWGRGQYPVSYSFLSKRWNWSIHKVRIFLSLLKMEQQVTTSLTGKTTMITLCNYDFYNPNSQADGKERAGGTAQSTAQSTAQITTNKSVKYNNNSQADGKMKDKQTAIIRIEEDKEDKEKEKENFLISNPEEAPLHIQDNSFMDYEE